MTPGWQVVKKGHCLASLCRAAHQPRASPGAPCPCPALRRLYPRPAARLVSLVPWLAAVRHGEARAEHVAMPSTCDDGQRLGVNGRGRRFDCMPRCCRRHVERESRDGSMLGRPAPRAASARAASAAAAMPDPVRRSWHGRQPLRGRYFRRLADAGTTGRAPPLYSCRGPLCRLSCATRLSLLEADAVPLFSSSRPAVPLASSASVDPLFRLGQSPPARHGPRGHNRERCTATATASSSLSVPCSESTCDPPTCQGAGTCSLT